MISWTATQNGRRIKLRYLGTGKNDTWTYLPGSAGTENFRGRHDHVGQKVGTTQGQSGTSERDRSWRWVLNGIG